MPSLKRWVLMRSTVSGRATDWKPFFQEARRFLRKAHHTTDRFSRFLVMSLLVMFWTHESISISLNIWKCRRTEFGEKIELKLTVRFHTSSQTLFGSTLFALPSSMNVRFTVVVSSVTSELLLVADKDSSEKFWLWNQKICVSLCYYLINLVKNQMFSERFVWKRS